MIRPQNPTNSDLAQLGPLQTPNLNPAQRVACLYAAGNPRQTLLFVFATLELILYVPAARAFLPCLTNDTQTPR